MKVRPSYTRYRPVTLAVTVFLVLGLFARNEVSAQNTITGPTAEVILPAEGTLTTRVLTATNPSWTAVVSGQDTSWLTVDPLNGTDQISFSGTVNSSDTARTATVQMTGPNVDIRVTVTQNGTASQVETLAATNLGSGSAYLEASVIPNNTGDTEVYFVTMSDASTPPVRPPGIIAPDAPGVEAVPVIPPVPTGEKPSLPEGLTAPAVPTVPAVEARK